MLALHAMATFQAWLLRLKLAKKDFFDSGSAISESSATDSCQSVDPIVVGFSLKQQQRSHRPMF